MQLSRDGKIFYGKIRTILGMIYRFLKSGRFRRILFLIDRTSFEKETRIQVATVQSMVKRILYNEDNVKPSVTDYDLIIIDEAHRGYIFDKEISVDEENIFANQQDYQSKYRNVIEYFNAVRIALTTTPVLHTTKIFCAPIFKYSYREAVIDGYLVDHDAPYILKTKLSVEGIHYKKGDNITIYDPATGEITNSELLEDELNFDIENFNRQVVNENFNRVVLEEIAKDIDPDAQGKTLIYAVDDKHADLMVKILKEIYSAKGANTEAIMKITGSVGYKRRINDAIRRFKNERYSSIVVPQIDKLIFMRRVKSRILFEQMLGRATQLCPEIGKTHFEIYDAVGVYESFEPVSEMKPVVANPAETFESRLEKLKVADNAAQIQKQINQLIGKVQRANNKLNGENLEQIQNLIGEAKNLSPHVDKKFLLHHVDFFRLWQQKILNGSRPFVISDHEDELIAHKRGYGIGQKPQDYLEEFAEFLKANQNEIATLNILCTHPKDLTRADLKSSRISLDVAVLLCPSSIPLFLK